jgi:hypothetical protein
MFLLLLSNRKSNNRQSSWSCKLKSETFLYSTGVQQLLHYTFIVFPHLQICNRDYENITRSLERSSQNLRQHIITLYNLHVHHLEYLPHGDARCVENTAILWRACSLRMCMFRTTANSCSWAGSAVRSFFFFFVHVCAITASGGPLDQCSSKSLLLATISV